MPKSYPQPVQRRPYSKPEKLVEIYQWIEKYIEQRGFPPTIMEMVDEGFGPSTSVIRYYLARMTEEGMIEVTPRISRGIRLLPIKSTTIRIQELMEEVKA